MGFNSGFKGLRLRYSEIWCLAIWRMGYPRFGGTFCLNLQVGSRL